MATKSKATIDTADLAPKATARGLELLPQVAKALLLHACQDTTRPQICGLGIDGKGTGAFLCATDGHRLIRMPIVGDVPSGIANLIATAEVNAAILRAEAGDVTGAGVHGATLIVIPWMKEIDLRFPPASQVIPPDARGETIAWMDPAYLSCAAKAGETFAKIAHCRASLAIGLASMGGELDPVRFDLNLRGVTLAQIVIMPLRVDGKATLPATHLPRATPTACAGSSDADVVPSATVSKSRKRAAKASTDREDGHVRASEAA